MTNYEMIKQSSIEDLAIFLCAALDERIKQSNIEDLAIFLCDAWQSCSECPAREFCYFGHTGMKDWLEKECD